MNKPSGNIFMLSSASRSWKNRDKQPKKRDKSELSLLKSNILELYIGFMPIGIWGFLGFHRLSNSIFNFRKLLPPILGAKKFVHACIFLLTDYSGEGILVEYGAYLKGDYHEKYPYEVIYYKDNGLRYTQMNLDIFKKIMIDENKDINLPEAKIKNIPYIKCKVNSSNLFYQLLFRTIFGEQLIKNPTWALNKILFNDDYKDQYCAEAYKLLENDCQCFVTKMIEASFCTINTNNFNQEDEINEYLPYLPDSKIDYDTLSYMIPTNISKALENNQKKIEERISGRRSTCVENNINIFNNRLIFRCLGVPENLI